MTIALRISGPMYGGTPPSATSVIRSPRYYSQTAAPYFFWLKKKPLIRSPVNTANGHILKSQTVESFIILPR